MNRRYVSLFLVTLLVAILCTTLWAQPEEIIINNEDAYREKQRPQVTFPHGIHMAGDLSCTDCHHIYSDGKNILDESELEEGNPDIRCTACHDQETRINLRQAFHRQCVGCHGRAQRQGEETGPRLCGECHLRR